ncbi:MAG: His/Gly/Thr/Pro-type tRNA ligase C-terminal domain-containing protein, partial [Elainellaceae cyanobacterium]
LGGRVEVDLGGDRLGKMIRTAEQQKIPVMAVVGAKEVESNSLSLRVRRSGQETEDVGSLPLDAVLERLQTAIAQKTAF